MSDTRLHKEKGKTRRNVIEGTPLEVKLYFDRKCGKIDGKKQKKRWSFAPSAERSSPREQRPARSAELHSFKILIPEGGQ